MRWLDAIRGWHADNVTNVGGRMFVVAFACRFDVAAIVDSILSCAPDDGIACCRIDSILHRPSGVAEWIAGDCIEAALQQSFRPLRECAVLAVINLSRQSHFDGSLPGAFATHRCSHQRFAREK